MSMVPVFFTERETGGASPEGARPSRARRLASRRVYDGRVFAIDVDEVVEPGGIHVEREIVRHRGSIAVLPVHADGGIVLVRQYRYAVDALLWELPAGRLDPDETPAHGAARELEEETGLRASQLEPLTVYYSTPGFCDETLHLFRASRLTPVAARPDDDERIEARVFDLDDACAMIDRGAIRDGKTLIALLMERARRKA